MQINKFIEDLIEVIRKDKKEILTNMTYSKTMTMEKEQIITNREIVETVNFEVSEGEDYLELMISLRKKIEEKVFERFRKKNILANSFQIKHSFELEYGSDPELKCVLSYSALETEDEAKERIFKEVFEEVEKKYNSERNVDCLVDEIKLYEEHDKNLGSKYLTLSYEEKNGKLHMKKYDISAVDYDKPITEIKSFRNAKNINLAFEV